MRHDKRGVLGCVLLLAALGTNADGTEAQLHWGYDGKNGPEYWQALDFTPAVNKCGGSAQSPINLETSKSKASGPSWPVFDSKASPMHLINNGHILALSPDGPDASRIKFNGEEYTLLQFHFHWPGEHTIDGKSFPLELRLVYHNNKYVQSSTEAPSSLLNLAVLFQYSATDNALLKDMVSSVVQLQKTGPVIAGPTMDPGTLLPAKGGFFSYSGSITTPPCSENVNWIVMDTPLEVSRQQFAAFQGLVDENHHAMTQNNRPIQKLNNRLVFHTAAKAPAAKQSHRRGSPHPTAEQVYDPEPP